MSLNAWCDDQSDGCEGLRDLDSARAQFLAQCGSSPNQIELRTCGNTVSIGDGDGFIGRTLYYDEEGKLIAGSNYDDMAGDEQCGAFGGKRPTVDWEACSFCVLCAGWSGLEGFEACDPKLAAPLVDACVVDAPETFQSECRSCACDDCYPVAVAVTDPSLESYYADEFERCADSQCESCQTPRQSTP